MIDRRPGRRLAVFLATGLAAGSLAACGSDSSASQTQRSPSTSSSSMGVGEGVRFTLDCLDGPQIATKTTANGGTMGDGKGPVTVVIMASPARQALVLSDRNPPKPDNKMATIAADGNSVPVSDTLTQAVAADYETAGSFTTPAGSVYTECLPTDQEARSAEQSSRFADLRNHFTKVRKFLVRRGATEVFQG